MINFFICDDNEAIRNHVGEVINKLMMKNNYNYKIRLYSDYNKDFIDDMNTPLSNKIYILDMETPSGLGLDIARKIREKDITSVIIFLACHYEISPVLLEEEIMFLTFIQKFNNQDKRLISAINKSLKILGQNPVIRFDDHGTIYTIPIDDILYITRDSINRKCIIKTEYNEFKINRTLVDILETLDEDFVRTHRSCIVNRNRVRIVNKKKHFITFDNNETIYLLSNNYKDNI